MGGKVSGPTKKTKPPCPKESTNSSSHTANNLSNWIPDPVINEYGRTLEEEEELATSICLSGSQCENAHYLIPQYLNEEEKLRNRLKEEHQKKVTASLNDIQTESAVSSARALMVKPKEEIILTEIQQKLLEHQDKYIPIKQYQYKLWTEQHPKSLLKEQYKQHLVGEQHQQNLAGGSQQEKRHQQKVRIEQHQQKLLEEQHQRKLLEERHERKRIEEEYQKQLIEEQYQKKMIEELNQQKLIEQQRQKKLVEEEYQKKLLEQQHQQKLLEKEYQRKLLEEQHHKKFMWEQQQQISLEEKSQENLMQKEFQGKKRKRYMEEVTKLYNLAEAQVKCVVPLRNRLASHAVLKDPLAKNWDSMPLSKTFMRTVVEEHTDEFRTVKNCFKATTQRRFEVVKIERVQNPFLLGCYILKRLEMKNKFGAHNVRENIVFRGTFVNNVDKICENNFDWRLYADSRGNRFGKGVSFTPISYFASHYSDKYATSKAMFLVRVLVSKIIEGNENMEIPPLVEGEESNNSILRFDTTKRPDGKIIVKYSDNEFYPDYVIYYTINPEDEKKGN